MKRHFRITGLILLCSLVTPAATAAALSTEAHTLKRSDDSSITFYVTRHDLKGRAAIVLSLQGSECNTVDPRREWADRLELVGLEQIARLDIEKYGIEGDHRRESSDVACPWTYLAHNTVQGRVLDVLQVVADLRRNAAWWNGRLYLVGTSEGATIAALAGPLIPETAGIVLLNGSIGAPFREGYATAMANSVRAAGGSDAEIEAVRKEADATWSKARSNPTAGEQAFGNGNTLKWWASIIDERPLNLLTQTDAPVLLLQSELDEMTPADSVGHVRKVRKANLEVEMLPGLTHGLRTRDGKPAWKPVIRRISRWIDRLEGDSATAGP